MNILKRIGRLLLLTLCVIAVAATMGMIFSLFMTPYDAGFWAGHITVMGFIAWGVWNSFQRWKAKRS